MPVRMKHPMAIEAEARNIEARNLTPNPFPKWKGNQNLEN